jgi:hypothetical protein
VRVLDSEAERKSLAKLIHNRKTLTKIFELSSALKYLSHIPVRFISMTQTANPFRVRCEDHWRHCVDRLAEHRPALNAYWLRLTGNVGDGEIWSRTPSSACSACSEEQTPGWKIHDFSLAQTRVRAGLGTATNIHLRLI